MANAGPNTNGSQFFVMHADYGLPPNYTIFGKLTGGEDVVDKIADASTRRQRPPARAGDDQLHRDHRGVARLGLPLSEQFAFLAPEHGTRSSRAIPTAMSRFVSGSCRANEADGVQGRSRLSG